jgi:hypothetical protein
VAQSGDHLDGAARDAAVFCAAVFGVENADLRGTGRKVRRAKSRYSGRKKDGNRQWIDLGGRPMSASKTTTCEGWEEWFDGRQVYGLEGRKRATGDGPVQGLLVWRCRRSSCSRLRRRRRLPVKKGTERSTSKNFHVNHPGATCSVLYKKQLSSHAIRSENGRERCRIIKVNREK